MGLAQTDTIELESTLLAADNPEAKHVDAPGLHLLHVLLKLGGKRLSEGRFQTALFNTETGISMVTGGSCCPLIGWNKSWSVSVQQIIYQKNFYYSGARCV